MNFSFGRRQEKVDWRILGDKAFNSTVYQILIYLNRMECTIGIQYMYLLVGVFRIYTLVNNWQSQSGGWVSEKHPGASTISN